MLGQFEIYMHNNPEITTITGFLQEDNGIGKAFNNSKAEFLNYDGGTGVSNLDRVYAKYTEEEQEENQKGLGIELLKPNTTLLVPKSLLNKEILSITGKNQFLRQGDFRSFYGRSLLQLLGDPLYSPSIKLRYDRDNTFTSLFPYVSVWIYVGALDSILNVTPYVMSCNTSVFKSGGTFSFDLPGVVSLRDEDIYRFGDGFYSGNNISSGAEGSRNEFYFHRYIQANDIVFIKYERLDIENNERLDDFVLSKSVLSKQVYDMIGLVDMNSRSSNFEGNDVTVSITGRDFMKLLIDDGSYFFPLLFVEGSEDTFINRQGDDKFIQRAFTTGRYESLYIYSYRSIRTTLQFIINQLANLGVVDEGIDLFSSYGDRRTKVYRLDNETGEEFNEELHIGVWQIIKLLVDSNIEDRRVADPSISQPDGSLINQFYKLCQEPFVEFFGDTYGDFYNFIVRQPPYTRPQIISFLDGVASDDNSVQGANDGLVIQSDNLGKREVDLVITIDPSDIISESIEWENGDIYCWYEILPQGAFLGQQNNMSLAYIPVVYFPEYANKWGSRRLSVVSNYISYQAFTGTDTDVNRDLFKEAVVNDFKFLIDSYSYMPFTRRGNIIINGDRRIKRGTWIRHGGTGEVYMVDQVDNSFSVTGRSIDRTTSLSLSRGMVERYTRGNVTYFDIVDTDFIREVLIERLTTGTSSQSKPRVNVKSNFLVNREVFDFFYNRQQFNNNI